MSACYSVVRGQATATAGKALVGVSLNSLKKHDLNNQDVVSHGYHDGGSNMRGESKGIRTRIKEQNSKAAFTHCYMYARNLNRSLTNAECVTILTQMYEIYFELRAELILTFC